MLGSRKAALCLHSLGQEDRSWLLQQLPASEQRHMQGLLGELETLGIPKDYDWQDLDRHNDNVELDEQVDEEYQLDSTPAGDIWSVLCEEPSPVIAAVLACRQWSWRRDILDLHTKYRRRDLILPSVINKNVRQALISSLLLQIHQKQTAMSEGFTSARAARSHGFFKRLGMLLWPR